MDGARFNLHSSRNQAMLTLAHFHHPAFAEGWRLPLQNPSFRSVKQVILFRYNAPLDNAPPRLCLKKCIEDSNAIKAQTL